MKQRPEFHQREKMKKSVPFIRRKSLKKRPLRTSNAANISSKTYKSRTVLDQIGSGLEKITEKKWVYSNDEMVYRSISYVPFLYKMFEVILEKAAHNIEDDVDCLKVNIDHVKNTVSVFFDGRGVYPGAHQAETVADATILTEKNYCTEFVVEIADGLRLNKFKQVFKNKMKKKPKPKTTKREAGGGDWTRLTFKPNLKMFKMEHLEDDVVALMKKHVLDMAENLGKTVEVELNDRLVRIIESFEDYAVLCMKSAENSRPVNPIELALSEEKAEDRNTWNRNFESGKELIFFSSADLKRSIPSMVDGLKPDQRKVLCCAFERKLHGEIIVSDFIHYMSWHNGQKNLGCAIIEMAQDFVGSNNINLLIPNGQFGTRDFGGKDHGSARCLYTKLNPLTRYLFHEDDDEFLDHLNKDGTKWYIPIIPLVLVNGSRGIGAGWTSIPSYSPLQIIENVKLWLKGEEMVPMVPSYRRFKGTVEKSAEEGEYRVRGCGEMVKIAGQHTFKITELPIGMSTEHYIVFLESIADWSKEVKDPLIVDFTHNWKDYANVDTKIKIKPDKIALLNMLSKDELYEKFKLISTVSTNNMHLFDAEGKIKKFDNPEQILKEFCELRLPYYDKRKVKVLRNLEERIVKLQNKARFLSEVLNGDIVINRPQNELILELRKKGYFACMPRKGKSAEPQVPGPNDDNSEAHEDDNNKKWGGYEYLLFIPIRFYSKQYANMLLAKMKKKMAELNDLKKRSSSEMWLMDLVELEEKIKEINRKEEEAEKERKRSSQAGKTTKTKKPENTSMEVDSVVVVDEVAKPKGRAGSPKTQKDDITRLQNCLDAHFKSPPSSEMIGGRSIKAIKNYIIAILPEKKKQGFLLDTEMEAEAVRLAKLMSSRFAECSDSESECSESKTEGLKVNRIAHTSSESESECSESESECSESETEGLKVNRIAHDSDSDDSDDSDSDDSDDYDGPEKFYEKFYDSDFDSDD